MTQLLRVSVIVWITTDAGNKRPSGSDSAPVLPSSEDVAATLSEKSVWIEMCTYKRTFDTNLAACLMMGQWKNFGHRRPPTVHPCRLGRTFTSCHQPPNLNATFQPIRDRNRRFTPITFQTVGMAGPGVCVTFENFQRPAIVTSHWDAAFNNNSNNKITKRSTLSVVSENRCKVLTLFNDAAIC